MYASRLTVVGGGILFLAMRLVCPAQDLTVHVLTATDPKPASGIAVQLFPQPFMSGSRKIINQKSDSKGIVVFHDIDLTSIAWMVSIYNWGTVATDPAAILCAPENASAQAIRGRPITVTSLPAEITIHVRKRTASETLRRLFVIP